MQEAWTEYHTRLASVIALGLYTVITVLLINAFDITLTLPGIAGIILSIGMAVDADVIIFARIREELAKGKTVASAIDIGFKKAMSAILDGNITTLIAAFVLGIMGSGSVDSIQSHPWQELPNILSLNRANHQFICYCCQTQCQMCRRHCNGKITHIIPVIYISIVWSVKKREYHHVDEV